MVVTGTCDMGGLSLAAVTLPDISNCICEHGWPIVALGVGFMGQRLAAWMIYAYPIMELCQNILPLFVSEALKVWPV